MKRLLAVLLVLALAGPALAQSVANQTINTMPTANSTFLPDLQNFLRFEDANRFVQQFTDFVVSGGTHGTGAGLTKSPTALVAFPGGQYTTESGSVTYNDNDTCWVIADKAISGNSANFTRSAGTHYLVDCTSVSKPSLPAGSVWLMQVVTAGGSVTTVTDLRTRVPFARLVLFSELGAAGTPGRLAFVTDVGSGTYYWDNGAAWVSFAPPAVASTVLANWVTNGDVENWFSGFSSAPTGWTLTGAGAAVARSTTFAKVTSASVQATSGGGALAQVYQDVDLTGGVGPAARWGGKTVTAGAWVRATAASAARIGINDGVNATFYSSFHAGSSAFVFLTVTATLTATPTRVRVILEVASGVNTAQFDGVAFGEGQTLADFLPGAFDPVLLAQLAPFNAGRLSFVSATSIKFCPYNGTSVWIQVSSVWVARVIPSACTTAANTGISIDGTGGSNLAASTTYFVYLFDSSGTLVVDFSTTTHAIDATAGVETKSAVATRTLIGMIRTNGASQFSAFLTLSWFNRATKNQTGTFSADRTTTSGTYVELNSEIRTEFISWADEAVFTAVVGGVSNSAADSSSTAIGFDGTAAEAGFETIANASSSTLDLPIAIAGYKSGLSEGYHYATLLGKTNAGTTGTWSSATAGRRAKVYIHVGVRG